ncbi:hypothetical protein QYF36_013224 [Acer negundo]|nr:hypothetical protein QYF36_013224 [Acer negundo]
MFLSGKHIALLLVVTILSTSVASTLSQNTSIKITHHSLLNSTCSATFYPELCFSAISALPAETVISKIKSPKDVIELSLNLTITAVQHNYFTVKKLISTSKNRLTKREITSLHDCLELVDETLDELYKTEQELQAYPTFNNESITEQADGLKILLSAAMTNQETCLDGFSHDHADKKVREALVEGQMHVFHMCSNALAMIKNLTDTDMASEVYSSGRHLDEEENYESREWPEWLSAGDRRLLQATTVTPDVTVAADGSGDYLTVEAAVAAAPTGSSKRYIIKIKAGVYKENVEVTKKKINIMFVGDGRVNTIITGSRNVVDGSTTFSSATVGTVDFIFGNAAAVFQNCDIHARRPNPGQKNMVTAQGRDDPNQNTGIVIQKCRIGGTKDLLAVKGSFATYLGRPWKLYSRTVIMQSDISDVVHPAGWFEWDGNFALNTLFYREYANTGAGALTSARVAWKGFKEFTSATEAQPFTAGNFIAGGSWLGSTGFPFSLGL